MRTIKDVHCFWEKNPLWTGESNYQPGTKAFFEEHRNVCINDCFAGELDARILSTPRLNSRSILDLGCGIGFWTVEFGLHGCSSITAADLTRNALELTKKRCKIYGIDAKYVQENAESLTFQSASFSHVNCLGVIHHTPNPEACIKEIHRVLEHHGTACISVYYKNIALRFWPAIKWIARILASLGARLSGRGRENLYRVSDVNEIVRLFDGEENPIGVCYSRKEFIHLLEPYFSVQELFVHYFPARTLPFKIPKKVHRFLDRSIGFLIYANVTKRTAVMDRPRKSEKVTGKNGI